jgi:hypothetical protein
MSFQEIIRSNVTAHSGNKLKISVVRPTDSASRFFHYLDFPIDLQKPFQLEFNEQRLRTEGIILIVLANKSSTIETKGCIYVEIYPDHLSSGQKIPIFGWFKADSSHISSLIFSAAEEYVSSQGQSQMRGPINVPSLFGGWGVCTHTRNLPFMIDSARNSSVLATWIKSAGYHLSTTYLALEMQNCANFTCPLQETDFEFVDPPVRDLLQNRSLMNHLYQFIDQNFSSYLPDHDPTKFTQFFAILSEIEQGEDFYMILREKATKKIIAVMAQVPNMFEYWQNSPITITDFNTAIVDKSYRNQMVVYWIYSKLRPKLLRRGIQREIATCVWKQNLPAMKSFMKSMRIQAEFQVYEKRIEGKIEGRNECWFLV